MQNSGTYEEALPCGGKLRVTNARWDVVYYFSGPDQRYNGTFVTLFGTTLQNDIDAYRENWAEYQTLKAALPTDGEFSKAGKREMQIRIGKFAEGVCIRSHHNPIRNASALERVITGYKYAIARAPRIQGMLASLPDAS